MATYNKDIDYKRLMNEAVAAQNYKAAALYEQQRNQKILGEKLNYETTDDYAAFLDQAPTYSSTRQPQIDALMGEIQNTPAFYYNPDTDATFGQYKKTYSREGQRSMQDTIGNVAANTGGLASSYAVTAGQQANNNYMARLADKIPELEQQEYGQYLDNLNMKIKNLNLLQGQEDVDYNRYLNDLEQYNYNQEFAYKQLQDKENLEYRLARDEIEDERYTDETTYARSQDTKENSLAWAKFNADMNTEDKSTKPTLTAAQTLSAIKSGVKTPEVLSAYEYYYGELYTEETPQSGAMIGSDDWYQQIYQNYGDNADIMLSYYYDDLGLSSSQASKALEGYEKWLKTNVTRPSELDDIVFSMYENYGGNAPDLVTAVKRLNGFTQEELDYMIKVMRELMGERN